MACSRAAFASSCIWDICWAKSSVASTVELWCRWAKNQHLPGLSGGERDLHHILPCLKPRIRVKSEGQPKGTKQPSVLNAQKYCLDEEVWLSSSGNLSVCIYINFRLGSLAQAVWNDIDSVRS